MKRKGEPRKRQLTAITGTLLLLAVVASFSVLPMTGNISFFDRFSKSAIFHREITRPATPASTDTDTSSDTLKATSCDADSSCETKSVSALDLKGQGNAYVCADSSGKLYRSATSCVTAICGNGIKEGTEVCDGTDFGGKTAEEICGSTMYTEVTCGDSCAPHVCCFIRGDIRSCDLFPVS